MLSLWLTRHSEQQRHERSDRGGGPSATERPGGVWCRRQHRHPGRADRLGGAEFRLPLLIGAFHFAALEAVILNKAISLVVVASALPFRTRAVPLEAMVAHWPMILNLLAGSLLGAWLGAGWATRLAAASLHRVIAVLLVAIAAVLLVGHGATGNGMPLLGGLLLPVVGVLAGFTIGVVAALLGVAGGELLIPTLVLLFGVDIKLAGRLSVAGDQPADDAGGLRALQPGPELRRGCAPWHLRVDSHPKVQELRELVTWCESMVWCPAASARRLLTPSACDQLLRLAGTAFWATI